MYRCAARTLLFSSFLFGVSAWGLEGDAPVHNAPSSLAALVDQSVDGIEPRVIEWRRDIHEHPELSNREFRTAALVAEHLRRLGLDVQTDVAHTGVVGLLRGARDNPVVALRADMDALPVTEALDLPFASKVKASYNNQEVGVMHACGHDSHVAILMGVAEVLSKVKDRLPGTVKFIFQPAEEGAPAGEEGGAELMVKEGVLQNPRPNAIFGLHVGNYDHGHVVFRSGPLMASADEMRITVTGKQTHGAQPWRGVDPVVVASQIVLGLQTVVSRQVDLTENPAVVSVGSIHGGVRFNIIPESVEMIGTIRAFDKDVQLDIHDRVRRTAVAIAQSADATAVVEIKTNTPVTVNDSDLTKWARPLLENLLGKDSVDDTPLITGAEDFAYYAQEIPGFYFFLGVTEEGKDPATQPANHSPRFYVDESALKNGLRALSNLTVRYLEEHP